jgi:hypothetical protein
MRSPLLLTVAGVALLSSVVVAQRQLQLVATITDPAGAEITTIRPEEVSVSEDGAPARILRAEVSTLTPKVQILVDNGTGFPAEAIGDLRNGVRALLETIPEGVEVSIVSTAPQPRFLQQATTDRQRLMSALDRLAPDSGAGRFVESLAEATQRIERDGNGRYVIVTVATSAGDNNPRERDIQQIQQRILKFRPTVHVVHLVTRGSGSGGVAQTNVGQAVTQISGGRYEGINSASRVATLLPEIGKEMAALLTGSSTLLRITLERPNGNSGELGRVSLGVTGKVVSAVALAQ